MLKPAILSVMLSAMLVAPGAWAAQRWVGEADGADGSAAHIVLTMHPAGAGALDGRFRCTPIIGRCISRSGAADVQFYSDGTFQLGLRFPIGIGCLADGSATGVARGDRIAGEWLCADDTGVVVNTGTFSATRRR